MKKLKISTGLFLASMVLFLLMVAQITSGQQTAKASAPIPDNLNKIFMNSCSPCHTNNGGMMSKSTLNFEVWTGYSPEKQAGKAGKIFTKLSKDQMPPKSAREKRPDAIPTKDQIELIKKWADSLKPVK
jgi:hypothetical protein